MIRKLIAALVAVFTLVIMCGSLASGIHVKHKTGRVLMRKAEVAEIETLASSDPEEEEPETESETETELVEEPLVEEPVEEMEPAEKPQPPPTTETDQEGTETSSGQEDEGNPQDGKTASPEADKMPSVTDTEESGDTIYSEPIQIETPSTSPEEDKIPEAEEEGILIARKSLERGEYREEEVNILFFCLASDTDCGIHICKCKHCRE